MDMEARVGEIKQNRFIRNFLKDRGLILLSATVLTAVGTIYAVFVYKPLYKSEAKIWIKDTFTRSYLNEGMVEPGYLTSLSSAGNPVMTQSEILTSLEMERYLKDFVIKEEARKHHGKAPDEEPDTHHLVKIKTQPNSDIIEVELKWDSPEMARRMLAASVQKLDETNLQFNRQIYTQKRVYIDKQIRDIANQLGTVRERIKQFQTGRDAVDVDVQTQELLRLKGQLTAQMESVMAARNNSASNAHALQSQLSLAPKEALTAVALGSGNANLVKMRTDLAVLKQQFAHDRVKEAETNPHLVALKDQINTLEQEIREETERTVKGPMSAKSPLIFDEVRGHLVQDLASSHARSEALEAEARSLNGAIARVNGSLKSIPQNRLTLTGLREEERALAMAYDELRKRQLDAQIKEAETPSNIFIVDPPSLPEDASFPTGLHMALMSMMLGLGVGFSLSMMKTASEDLCEGAEEVGVALRTKVLGIIPWTERLGINQRDSLFAMNNLACKHIISNLRIEASKREAQVVSFTSSAINKAGFGGAYYLARCMAALGQTVAFIDADLRPSLLLKKVAVAPDRVDLTDLVLSVDLKLRNGQLVQPDEILAGMTRDEHGVYLAVNRNYVANAFDYFSSKGFRHMVNTLKDHFDWVFIDTPPAALAPEFMTIAQISDGVVLFVDKNATYRNLRKISMKVQESQSTLLGAVVRERNDVLTWEYDLYSGGGTQGPPGGGTGTPAGNGVSALKKRVNFMGAEIDPLTMEETVDRISEMIDQRQCVQHVVVNVAKLMYMKKDRQLREIVNGSDLVNADGAGVILGARLLGIPIPERVAGIDLMHRLVAQADRKCYRIYFLGAAEDVVRDVVNYYRRLYPQLQVCGYRNGYFQPGEEADVAKSIREAKPDILFVGISSPKKENFIRDYKDVMSVPFVMGVGGSFDVIAGRVKRAPLWMQRVGMEWAFRLIQEPRRMWKRYLVTNVQFSVALAGQAVHVKLKPDSEWRSQMESVNG